MICAHFRGQASTQREMPYFCVQTSHEHGRFGACIQLLFAFFCVEGNRGHTRATQASLFAASARHGLMEAVYVQSRSIKPSSIEKQEAECISPAIQAHHLPPSFVHSRHGPSQHRLPLRTAMPMTPRSPTLATRTSLDGNTFTAYVPSSSGAGMSKEAIADMMQRCRQNGYAALNQIGQEDQDGLQEFFKKRDEVLPWRQVLRSSTKIFRRLVG